jgi:hypothetical protein
MVERFFRDLTRERLRRGVFTSVPQLIAAIETYIEQHNENPKPFVWTAKANDILQKVIRANRRLSAKQNGAHTRLGFSMASGCTRACGCVQMILPLSSTICVPTFNYIRIAKSRRVQSPKIVQRCYQRWTALVELMGGISHVVLAIVLAVSHYRPTRSTHAGGRPRLPAKCGFSQNERSK